MPTTPADPRWLDTASLTDVGRVRARNEDFCAELSLGSGRHLLVLADGMGGHRGGAIASQLACETACRWVADAGGASLADPEGLLAAAIQIANETVYARAHEDPALAGMGTTLVAALLAPNEAGDGGEAAIAHVGDSRAYLFSEGALRRLTDDHSVVALLVRQGAISEEEAATHPRRNEILRSVGSEMTVEMDLQRLALAPGDRLLLCSDGLCGVLTHEQLQTEAATERHPAEAAKHLVDAANRAGGPDNVTVQIADVLA